MTDVLALVSPALQERLQFYAAVAAYFRGSLPRSLNDSAGIITARFLAAFVHEEQENRRGGATNLHVGSFVEEDRGAGSQGGHLVPQLHSGTQAVALLTATDIDGNPVDASGATATTDNPGQLVPSIRQDPDGVKLVVADSPGLGVGVGNVTVTLGAASLTESFEVVVGDANILNLGAITEEPRP